VVGAVLDKYFPFVEKCAVRGVDTSEVVGPTIETDNSVLTQDVPPPVATPTTTVEDNVEVPTTTTDHRSVTATAVTGVDVDAAETKDGTAIAPEQHEVSGTATVVPDALPKTGGDGALLTMLGLALVASGAAVRHVARD
jgi:LPXTG-motif cell wall-anchored protein